MSGVLLSLVSNEDEPTRHWQLGTASMATYYENDLVNKVYIASGGFGDVCKYRNRKLGHDVIVKTCKGESAQGQKNLIDEATKHFRTGATHMNIVRVLGLVLFNDEVPGFILEYMDEGSLHTVIFENVKSPKGKGHYVYTRANVVSWCADIASALYFVHAQNLKHLDLKPMNVLMWRHRTSVKVSDFGISKFHSKTTTDVSSMTYSYAAPEMFDGHSSTLSDIYSFAVVMWTLINRRRPYSDKYGNHHNMAQLVFFARVKIGLRPEINESDLDELFKIMQSCWSPIERRWDAHTLLDSLVDVRDTMTQANSPPLISHNTTTLTLPLSVVEPNVGADENVNAMVEEVVNCMSASSIGSPTGLTFLTNEAAIGITTDMSSHDAEIEQLKQRLKNEKSQKDTYQATCEELSEKLKIFQTKEEKYQATCKELTEKLKISQQQTTEIRSEYEAKLQALDETHKRKLMELDETHKRDISWQDQLNETMRTREDNYEATFKELKEKLEISQQQTTQIQTEYKGKLQALDETHKRTIKGLQDQLNQYTKTTQTVPQGASTTPANGNIATGPPATSAPSATPATVTQTNRTIAHYHAKVPDTSKYGAINVFMLHTTRAAICGKMMKGSSFKFDRSVMNDEGTWAELSEEAIQTFCTQEYAGSSKIKIDGGQSFPRKAWALMYDKGRNVQLITYVGCCYV